MNSSQCAMRHASLISSSVAPGLGVADVLGDRAVEQEVLLQHRRELLAVVAQPDVGEIRAVDEDAPLASAG